MTKVRKILAVLVAAVMLVSIVALAACKATPLPVPVVTIDADGTASWKAIDGATGYGYKIGNGVEMTTTDTEVVGALGDGDSIIVRALGDGKKYSDSAYSEKKTYTAPTGPQALVAPVVTISASGLASWTAVSNASGYIYKINDGQEITLSATTLSVQLTAGQKIVVKAAGDDVNYEDSPYSEARTYVAKLATPVVSINVDTGIATWAEVPNATGYVYKIGGGEEQTATERSVQLQDGDTFTVKATTTNTTAYSDSDYSAPQTYTSAGVVVALDKPVVEIDEEGNATWAEIANAVGYTYKINDGTEQNLSADTRTVKLQDGESIVVMAIGDGTEYTNSQYSDVKTYVKPIVRDTYYEKESDVFQEGNYRYQIFTTNNTNADTDSVIAIRRGTKEGNAWTYGNFNVAIEGSANGWDKYVTSASVVRGVFTKGSETYNYLMAYSASSKNDESSASIGFAVAKEMMGEWTKVGTDAIVKFELNNSGTGCYAPSLVNPGKLGAVRLFYTYADKYGHFARMTDIDFSDLDNIVTGNFAVLPNAGSSDTDGMFPNSDWAYDAVNHKYYVAKDVSPAPDGTNHYADEFELVSIDEDELYTTDIGKGYNKLQQWNSDALELKATDRMHSPCIVTDEYGCISNTTTIELNYSFCSAQSGSADTEYLFTQRLRDVTYTAVAA